MGNIFKYSNVGGFKTTTHYPDMLAGNTVWNPYSPTGAYDALATVTVPSGGVSSITFSGIPSTYTHLEIRGTAGNSTTAGGDINLRMQLNGVTTANYPWHYLEGDGASASAGNSTTETGWFQGRISNGNSPARGATIMTIQDYTSLNKNKTIKSLSGVDTNGAGYVGLYSGTTTSSINAVTSILLYPQGGSFAQYSTFSLYGVR